MSNEEMVARLSVPVGERDHVSGGSSAAVTLVEYGDYECSHCGEAYPIVKAIQSEMGDKLRFVFRNFPLAQAHIHAQDAAESAEIAGEEGKFWEMHDMLFEHQNALTEDDLIRYATEVGADPETFSEELRGHTRKERVREDFLSGVKSGVNGTPTFFINGVRFDSSWDKETLTAALNSAG